MITQAILSLGSNMGDKLKNLKKALESIHNIPETEILKISNFYETEPFEVTEPQNKYINCCAKISTQLNSYMLMGACLGIESCMGRRRTQNKGPRIIDIDIIAYGNETKNEKNLTLPHPEMKKRAFVLIPFRDVCEDMCFENIYFKPYLDYCNISEIKLIRNLVEKEN